MKVVEREQHLDVRLAGECEQGRVRRLGWHGEVHGFGMRGRDRAAEAQAEQTGKTKGAMHEQAIGQWNVGGGSWLTLGAQFHANGAVRLMVDLQFK